MSILKADYRKNKIYVKTPYMHKNKNISKISFTLTIIFQSNKKNNFNIKNLKEHGLLNIIICLYLQINWAIIDKLETIHMIEITK